MLYGFVVVVVIVVVEGEVIVGWEVYWFEYGFDCFVFVWCGDFFG